MQNFHALSPQNLWLPQYIHAFTNQEALVSFSIHPEFLLEFHHKGMSDWVQSHSQWFNLQLPSLPQSLDCSQGTQTPNLLYPHLVLMTSSHPESSLLINIQHGFQPDLIATWNWVYYQYWWNKLSTVVFPYMRFHFTVLVTCDQPQSENRKFQKWLTIHAFSIECHSK